MDKLLQILQLIVEEPGVSFRCLLPSILELCLQTALPMIGPNVDAPDFAIALFKCLHSILLHRWQFFKQSQVRLGHSPGASDSISASEEVLQHTEQFIQILEAFGRALLQPDINIFKLSLNSLEDLNAKWKLYHNVSRIKCSKTSINRGSPYPMQPTLQTIRPNLDELQLMRVFELTSRRFAT